MKRKKHAYATVGIEHVDVGLLVPLLLGGCIVALDVAKEKFVAAVATIAGEVLKLVRFRHPEQTLAFVRMVENLCRQVDGKVQVAMEPTGVYGDAVRHQVRRLGVSVHMVSPKRTHDSRELFDGVPSLHDPKSAVLVAKLCALKLSTEWEEPKETRVRIRALVEQRRFEHEVMEMGYGKLEALLSRHWPELGSHMDIRGQRSTLRMVATFGGPASVAEKPDEVRALLRTASRNKLAKEAVDGVIASASTTLGMPTVAEEDGLLRATAGRVFEALQRADEVERALVDLVPSDVVLERLSACMGVYTAAVLVAKCDPRQYTHARQLEKAAGLNLREKSSGELVGRVHLTKRGPGLVRQVLFLWALREIGSNPIVRAWYLKRRGYTEARKMSAVVAVMRKLCRSVWHVAKGQEWDASKLFDVRRLDVEASAAQMKSLCAPKRTTPATRPRPQPAGALHPEAHAAP